MANAMQGIMSLPDQAAPAPEVDLSADPSLNNPLLQSYAQTKPVEFGRDILGSIAANDPDVVAEFVRGLSSVKLTPEEIDALGQVIDMILANPERYPEIRERLITEDNVPEDVLPEEFDPAYFTAFNIALDQLSEIQAANPAPMQMAKGGIATLKPIAAEIAKMGRNGDTMLAHIMPHEARMLRRRGGSGTINPKTGLPEFFLDTIIKGIGKAFSAVGRFVKSIAQTTVGKIVLTAAAMWALGPIMAPYMTSMSASVAFGVKTFAASTLVNLAAGADLGDALKGGAINGLLAGVGNKVFELGKSYISSKTASAAANAAQQGDEIVAAAKDVNAPVPSPDRITTSGVDQIDDMLARRTTTEGLKADAIGGRLAEDPASFYRRGGMDVPFPSNALTPSGMAESAVKGAAGAAAPPVPNTSAAPVTAPTPLDLTRLSYQPRPFDVGKAITGVGAPDTPVTPQVIPKVAPPPISVTTPTAPVGGVDGMGIRLADRAGSGFTVDPDTLTSGGKPTVAQIGTTATQTSAEQGIGSLVQPGAAGAGQPGMMDLLGKGRYMDAAKQAYGYISPSEIQRQGIGDALKKVQEQFPGVTTDQIIKAAPGSVLNTAYQNALPGFMATYGPLALAGTLGAAALGAFNTPANPKPASFSGPTGMDLLNRSPGTYGLNFGGVRTSFAPNPYETMPRYMAMGGIASLGSYAHGGSHSFPRKTGPINGPGTGTSDSIPAMLSDGEFVFTAKAVRAMGGGSRRAGAKKMYALMKALEKKA